MSGLFRVVVKLQRSQLSVQALSRLSSVFVFLLARYADGGHLALVALQGVLFAIPFTLIEALVGRPLSADLIPPTWDLESWARRSATLVMLPVGVVCYLASTLAFPHARPLDLVLMIAPVLVQLPVEAAFWAMARAGSRVRANLVPQLSSLGAIVAGVPFVLLHIQLDLVWLPAQLAVLLWTMTRRRRRRRRRPAVPDEVRPPLWQSLRVGLVYCVAAGIDLSYSIALPSVAGFIAGPAAIVVIRAMELAFGPMNVALSASLREDVVAGRNAKLLTATRALTLGLAVAVSAVILASPWVRGRLAEDLGRLGGAPLVAYCGYKIVQTFSTWESVWHMIWAPSRRYLASAIGSRVLAFVGIAVSLVWLRHITGLFVQLLVTEVGVAVWYAARIRLTGTRGAHRSVRQSTVDPALVEP